MTKKQTKLLMSIFALFIGVIYSQFHQQIDQWLPKDITDIKGVVTTPTQPPTYIQTGVVIEVIDGDTIKLDTGQVVRYIGIDTPETKHPIKSVQCYGKEAYEINKKLVEGRKVRLIKDISETDRYGRLLRYVYVTPDASSEAEVFVNNYLVREGYATAVTYPPDVKFSEHFNDLQNQARDAKKGLWSTCYSGV